MLTSSIIKQNKKIHNIYKRQTRYICYLKGMFPQGNMAPMSHKCHAICHINIMSFATLASCHFPHDNVPCRCAMSSAMSSLSWQGYHKCLVPYTLRYDGSSPTFVRAKRKIVERLEARRARLLAGLRRVPPPLLSWRSASSLSGLKHDERGCLQDCNACPFYCVVALVPLPNLSVFWSGGIQQCIIFASIMATSLTYGGWRLQQPSPPSCMSLTICCWFVFICAPSSLAVLRYSVSILFCYFLLP
jgi:hypothetical protein